MPSHLLYGRNEVENASFYALSEFISIDEKRNLTRNVSDKIILDYCGNSVV